MSDQVNPLGGLQPGAHAGIGSAPLPQRPWPLPASSGPLLGTGEVARTPGGLAAPITDLRQAAEQVAASVHQAQSTVRFLLDETTGQYYFKVVDADTQKVIRQVPSEEVLTMARRLQELGGTPGGTGLLMDATG